MISIEEIDRLLDNNGVVIDSNGDKVGKVEQVFVGDASHEPQWVTAKTGLFGHSETYIPLKEATVEGTNVRVPYDKAKIKDAPRTENKDGHLEPEQEAELYRYYGLTPAGSGGDDGGKANEADAGDAGGVRLRKYTVRENVTMSVPVEHEEVRVVQETPDSDSGPDRHQDSAAGRGKAAKEGDDHRAKSEGFGENRYDQLTGSQSDDIERPRGTAEERRGTGVEHDESSSPEHRGGASASEGEHRVGASAPEGDHRAKSEGFGENRYDQLSGPQSEDIEHPRGTVEERPSAADPNDPDAKGRNEEEPLNTESHGRHAR